MMNLLSETSRVIFSKHLKYFLCYWQTKVLDRNRIRTFCTFIRVSVYMIRVFGSWYTKEKYIPMKKDETLLILIKVIRKKPDFLENKTVPTFENYITEFDFCLGNRDAFIGKFLQSLRAFSLRVFKHISNCHNSNWPIQTPRTAIFLKENILSSDKNDYF